MPNSYLTQAAECLHDAETLLNKVESDPLNHQNSPRMYFANELLARARGFLTRVDERDPESDTVELWEKQRGLRARWRDMDRRRNRAG